ncbi:DMT family transporter [Fluviibacterium sp. DFM31]|uniref:DMT family transporter n=1 Tax=Meridianimarinicoccus marinus TaxID=3231483 RepID=A0ABV3L4I4_9RHOB
MSSSALSDPRPIHWAGTISLGIIWGTAFMGMSVALEDMSPLWLAAGRLVIGAVTLLAIEAGLAAAGKYRPPTPLPWRFVLAIALLGAALPMALLTWGLQTVPSSFAGVSMAAVALFVLPLAHVFVPGETMTRWRTLGVLAGFLGVVLLIGPRSLLAGGGEAMGGRIACIGATLCYACASILTRRCPPIDPIRLARLMTGIAAIVLVILALIFEGWPTLPAGLPLLALLWVGVLPTGVANLIRVLIVRSVGPGFMSLTAYQVPVWSVIFGALLLGEPISLNLILAMALILAGIALTRVR